MEIGSQAETEARSKSPKRDDFSTTSTPKTPDPIETDPYNYSVGFTTGMKLHC